MQGKQGIAESYTLYVYAIRVKLQKKVNKTGEV